MFEAPKLHLYVEQYEFHCRDQIKRGAIPLRVQYRVVMDDGYQADNK